MRRGLFGMRWAGNDDGRQDDSRRRQQRKQIRLTGAFNFGQVTLKRGMTKNFDLWDWVDNTQKSKYTRRRANRIPAPDRKTERAGFVLSRCLPTKLKAPALNAKDGMVAIEELQLTYESLTFEQTGPKNRKQYDEILDA